MGPGHGWGGERGRDRMTWELLAAFVIGAMAALGGVWLGVQVVWRLTGRVGNVLGAEPKSPVVEQDETE